MPSNSSGRQPRAYIIAGGERIPVINIGVTQSRTKKSDSFTCNVAIGGPAPDISFWTDRDEIKVKAMFQNDIGAQATEMFDGYVDHVEIQLLARTVTITGRDKSEKLVDTKAQKKYLNKKPDEIIREEAQKAGLKTDMSSFKDKAGKLWQIDWNKFFHNHSLWTGINNLADNFGFSAYSTGGTLYIKPFNEKLEQYQIRYSEPTDQQVARGDFIDLAMSRNLPIAKGVSSKVSSWNNLEKKVISGQSGKSGGGSGVSGPLEYNLTVPGLQQSQAENLARKRYAETTSHEMTITVDMPGDTKMDSRKSIMLTGTNSSFDRLFDVQSVDHRMNIHDGYRMFIQARIPGKEDEDSGGQGGGGSGGASGGDSGSGGPSGSAGAGL